MPSEAAVARSLLIVEDDDVLRPRLARAFRERGFEVREAPDVDTALESARSDPPEYALVDLRLGTRSGLEVVRGLAELDPATAIVVLTGYGSIATALEAVRLGATHYLTKPADVDDLLAAFARAPGARPSRPTPRPTPRRRWRAWSGSTSTACSRTAAATSPRPPGSSASTAGRCSASSRNIRLRADLRASAGVDRCRTGA
jgi:ActR/RegA family two-component response regulator